MEQHPGLHRCRRPHLCQLAEPLLPGVDLLLAHLDQGCVARGQPAGFGARGVPGQGGQRLDPQPGQLGHVLPGEHTGREAEEGGQLVTAEGVGGHRVDLQRRQRRHVRVGRGDQAPLRGVRGPAQAPQFLGDVRAGGPAQVVEPDLRFPLSGQCGAGPGVEVAQQAVAQTVVRHRPQLFLDGLDRPSGGRTAGERVRHVDAREVEPYGEHRGEPADRARQVRAGHQVLFPAVSLQPDQRRVRRGPGHAPGPAPAGQRQREAGQQPVVGAAAEHRGHRVQQGLGDVGRHLDAHRVHGGRDIASGVQLPCSQHRLFGAQDLLPSGQFRDPPRGGRLVGERVRPSPERGAHARRFGGEAVTDPLPDGRQVRHQDPPRHPVDDQVVQHDQQPVGGRVGGEPHELRHDARVGVQPVRGRVQFGLRVGVGVAYLPHQRAGVHTAGRLHPQARVGPVEPGAQDVVPVEDGLQRGDQSRPVDVLGQGQHRGHAEPADATAQFENVRRRRRQRSPAHAGARQLRQGHGLLFFAAFDQFREPGDRAVLEDLPRADHHAALLGPGDDLDGTDAVAAAGEEVVVDAHPPGVEHVGVHLGQDPLRLAAGCPVLGAGELRFGQGGPVQLSARGQRQPVQHHEQGGHHVVRQPLGHEPPQIRHRDTGVRAGVAVLGARRCHITDEPRGAGVVLAHGDRCLADRGMPAEGRLDLGRLDADAVHLHLGVGSSLVPQPAVLVPAGQVTGAVHARAGGAERAGDEPLRGHRAVPVVAAGDQASDVQLAGHTGRDRGEFRSQNVDAHVGQWLSDRYRTGSGRLLRERVGGGVEALGLSVGVDDTDTGQGVVNLADQIGRECFTGEDDGFHVEFEAARGVGADLVEQRGEHRGHGADGGARPAAAFGEFEYVTDDFDARSGGERGEDLEHGDVEVHRGRGEHPGARPDPHGPAQVPHTVDHTGVGDGDALGRPGRSGREHHIGEVVRPDADVRGFENGAVEAQVIEVEYRQPALRHGRHRRVVGQHQRRTGGVEQLVDARGRVGGIDRQIGAAGLEHGEERDDQVGGAGQCHGDQDVRPDPAVPQHRGQPARAGLQLPVRQHGPSGHHRGRVRCLRRLGGDQLRHRRSGHRHGRLVELCQPVPFGSGEHVDRAEPRPGIGDHLPQHTHKALDKTLGRCVVEQFRRVLQPPVRTSGRGRDDVEEQVELRGTGARRNGGDRKTRYLDLPPFELPGQHHLEQRLVGGRTFRTQQLHQTLERHVLVVVRRKGPVPHLLQQIAEGGVSRQVDAQHPGVGEEPDQVVELLVGAPLDRAADRQVVAGAEVVQEHREYGLGDHRRRAAAVRGQFPDPCEEFLVQFEVDMAAVVAGRRRTRPVQRQLHRLRHLGQFLAPVVQLRRGDALRVLLVAQHLALPQRVVLVLHRKRCPLGRAPLEASRVRRQQVPHERRHRRPVRGDVVEHEHHHVLLRADAEHGGPQGEFRVQVEALARGLVRHGRHRVGGHVDHPQPWGSLLGRHDALLRCAVGVLDDQGAQALVPGDDIRHRRGQGRRVQRPVQAQYERDVVRRGRAFQTVEEPQPTLSEGQRDHRRTPTRSSGATGGAGGGSAWPASRSGPPAGRRSDCGTPW